MSKRSASNTALNFTRRYLTTSKYVRTLGNLVNAGPLQNRNLSMTATFTTASSSSTSPISPPTTGTYVSPYSDFFASMKSGKTALGTDHSKVKSRDEEIAAVPRLDCGIPEHVLRFSTVCHGRLHLTPYTHHLEHRVTMKVSMHHIPLETEMEREIFLQIVANRFVPERNELRLSANQFASRIENKRHLCSMLDRIVNGARMLAKDIQEQRQKQSDS